MNATIAKRFTFDAAHRLGNLPANHKCYRMHGHTYEVELVFTGSVDDGFVLDYADIATMWAPLNELLDHRVLNDVPGLEVPSTEHLAAWICAHMVQVAAERFSKVIVRESSTTWCEMTPFADLSIEEMAGYIHGPIR